jgi:hypothetical protein
MPQQELLAQRRGRQPDAGLDPRVQLGVLWAKPSLPHVLLHSTLLADTVVAGKTAAALLMDAHISAPARVRRSSRDRVQMGCLQAGISGYHISLQGASFSFPGAVAKW